MSDSTVRCQKCGHTGVPSPTVVLDLESEIQELKAELADLTADRERLAWLESEALVRNVGVESEMVRQDGNLLAADGWRTRWNPLAQGLPVNMRYTRTVRDAIDLMMSESVSKRSGLPHAATKPAPEKP